MQKRRRVAPVPRGVGAALIVLCGGAMEECNPSRFRGIDTESRLGPSLGKTSQARCRYSCHALSGWSPDKFRGRRDCIACVVIGSGAQSAGKLGVG